MIKKYFAVCIALSSLLSIFAAQPNNQTKLMLTIRNQTGMIDIIFFNQPINPKEYSKKDFPPFCTIPPHSTMQDIPVYIPPDGTVPQLMIRVCNTAQTMIVPLQKNKTHQTIFVRKRLEASIQENTTEKIIASLNLLDS